MKNESRDTYILRRLKEDREQIIDYMFRDNRKEPLERIYP